MLQWQKWVIQTGYKYSRAPGKCKTPNLKITKNFKMVTEHEWSVWTETLSNYASCMPGKPDLKRVDRCALEVSVRSEHVVVRALGQGMGTTWQVCSGRLGFCKNVWKLGMYNSKGGILHQEQGGGSASRRCSLLQLQLCSPIALGDESKQYFLSYILAFANMECSQNTALTSSLLWSPGR